MTRLTFPLAALALALPLAAQAQAFRCTDASGRVLYTDQPCDGGNLVVPALTPEEQERRRLAESEALARRAAERQQALESERLQLERERLDVQRSAVQAANPQDSSACREARARAEEVAGSRTSSSEQVRTARYNAALACGQQPPAEVVETTTVVRQPAYYDDYGRTPRYYNTTPNYGGYVSGRSGSVNWGVGFGSGGTGYTGYTRPAPGYVRPTVVRQQPSLRMNVPGTASLRAPQQNNRATPSYPIRVNP